MNSSYHIEERGANDNPDFMGMKLYFDPTVEVTASQKTIDGLTLMTRLGGATGVGKEMIWIILLTSEFLVLFQKQIREKIKI